MKNWIVALGLLLLALTASPAMARLHTAQAPGLHAETTVVAQTGGDDDDDGDDEDGEEDFV